MENGRNTMKFIDLLKFSVGGVDKMGRRVEEVEQSVIESAGFVYYDPDIVSIVDHRAVLIGFAYWSRYDLLVLDDLSESRSNFEDECRVYVFDFSVTILNQDDYRRYYPIGNIQGITHTPVIVWFENGEAVNVEQAGNARASLRKRLL